MSEPMTNEDATDIVVRTLQLSDLDEITRIDAHNHGSPRRDYYRLKLEQAMADTSVRMGLAAEIDGMLVGFLMGSMFHGDFGIPELAASIDAVGVHGDFARRGVATALWEQFVTNLKALRVERVRTQVAWNDWQLMSFFQKIGFCPGQHVCIERELD